jgi:hypothetical protein
MPHCSIETVRSLRFLRAAVLISSGSFALHQLRYLAGYGVGAGDELERTGHGYLGGLAASLAALALLVAAITVARMMAGRVAVPAAQAHGGRGRAWAGFALALLLIYATQESLEGVLASGHPGGLDALLAGGGWTALPLAALVALPLVVVHRAVAVLERRLAPRAAVRAARPLAVDDVAPARVVARTPRGGRLIADSLAKRPPPGALHARPA